MTSKLFFVCCLSVFVSGSRLARQAFIDSRIYPELVSKAPEKVCQVLFPSGAYADLGNTISNKLTTMAPEVSWPSDGCYLHTMVFLDPDVPSPRNPSLRSLQHQIVVNMQYDNPASGETLTSYIMPNPPQYSDPHRYVVLVYRQPDVLEFDEPRIISSSERNRTKFNLDIFVAKYNLGDPFCGNFFYAEYEP